MELIVTTTIPFTSTTAAIAGTGKGSKVAPELDRKLAGDEPLLEVADWYTKTHFALPGPDLDEYLLLYGMDFTAKEFAALSLCREGYQSEAEIDTRPCNCIKRSADVCQCPATLTAARNDELKTAA
jgi:hypothetical protein